jgi:outer membrane protein assembly factor BamB
VLTCFNAKTGEEIYQLRINEQGFGLSASPVAGNGKVYFASEDGEVCVIKAGSKYELIAINPMNEAMMATPAISDNMLIIRGQRHVFGIAERRN